LKNPEEKSMRTRSFLQSYPHFTHSTNSFHDRCCSA